MTSRSKTVSLNPIRALLTTWALAGVGAGIGSILGHAAGKRGLFAGAVAGGAAGVGAAVAVLTRLKWLSPEDRRGAFFGGIVGFAIAAPIAVTNLHTPVTPVLVCALTGLGLLLGVGVARGWRRGS